LEIVHLGLRSACLRERAQVGVSIRAAGDWVCVGLRGGAGMFGRSRSRWSGSLGTAKARLLQAASHLLLEGVVVGRVGHRQFDLTQHLGR
jgi:hypothetical protein